MPVTLPENYRPNGDEPYMNDNMREYFRLKLVAWREELLEDGEDTRYNLNEDAAKDSDFVDRASREIDQAIELRTRDRERKLLMKIEDALQRIKNGNYGFCSETNEPIGVRRLEARPVATLCLAAQERHEKHERGPAHSLE